jgi:hypothetical protein
MKISATWKWIVLALLGLLIAAGVAAAASRLASEQIGIASESVSAGDQLAPAVRQAASQTNPSPKPQPPPAEPETTTTESDDHGGDDDSGDDDGGDDSGGDDHGGEDHSGHGGGGDDD